MNSDFPSEREARSNRILSAVAAILFYAIAYAIARFAYGPTLGFVICTPILGVYLAWFLIHRAGSGFFFLKWMTLRKSNGRLHAFGDRPVRIEQHDGQCRVAARDLFDVLGESFDTQAIRRLRLSWGQAAFCRDERGQWWFEETAVLQWLARRAEGRNRTAQQLLWWLEREAFPALHRKREARFAAATSARDPTTTT
ncbi:MAG TPA: hypothetical protein VH183_03935 [Burkholderiaceae bacterium]|nr:hypothetical protein [Burkholderiaceae bacterium]